ncbi:MAG: hypothetical protein M3443_14805 [Actinomycetota bacterium]|nr:hypothetical protein [Actinomycetota bacterium]
MARVPTPDPLLCVAAFSVQTLAGDHYLEHGTCLGTKKRELFGDNKNVGHE